MVAHLQHTWHTHMHVRTHTRTQSQAHTILVLFALMTAKEINQLYYTQLQIPPCLESACHRQSTTGIIHANKTIEILQFSHMH